MSDPSQPGPSTDDMDVEGGLDLGDLAGLAVMAPIVVATGVARCVPSLVSSTKQRVERQLTVARMVGEMTTKVVGQRVQRRFSTVGEPSTGGRSAAPSAAQPPPAAAPARAKTEKTKTEKTKNEKQGSSGGARAARPSAASVTRAERTTPNVEPSTTDGEPMVTAAELPLEDYESLAASQVVRRLGDLDSDELVLVERFERSHRQRRTVLGKIAQLQGS